MTLHDAIADACRAVRVNPPRQIAPGRWVKCDTYERNGRGDGRVLVFDDEQGGIVWNHQTGQSERFRLSGEQSLAQSPRPQKARQREGERKEVAEICERIVRACQSTQHPYLERKGFPDEFGLVIERDALPPMTQPMRRALPDGDSFLIVPGRIGKSLTTVQFIPAEGDKKNILGGAMGGACHRISTGRETWVCEGIATALSVRAALRLLGRSATVLSAFSAANVAKVASLVPGAIIAADHDKPIEQFGGLGTGEYYAANSGRRWAMPPERGDWNDYHQTHGMRAVALLLREVPP